MGPAVPYGAQSEQATADAVFGAALPAAETYAALLAGQGVTWGLLGPREADRLWSRHLINSAALAPLVPLGADVLDVGSGAGLPGIPLRLARPDIALTLLEPLQRRVRFLRMCLSELALSDVSVVTGRAEQAQDISADVVTARAVAPLSRLLPAVWPLIRPGGQLLAIKGGNAEAELARCCGIVPTDLSTKPDVVRRTTDDGRPLVTVVRFQRRQR